jgi:tetratricopeptide (TPR) repeat protein
MTPRLYLAPRLLVVLLCLLLTACSATPTPTATPAPPTATPTQTLTPTPTLTPSPTPYPLAEWVAEADALTRQSAYDDAEALYRRVLSVNEEHVDAHLGYAYLFLWRLDGAASALEHARAAVDLAEDSPRAHALLALALDQLYRPDEALDAAMLAVGLDEDDAFAQMARAHASLSMYHYDEALEAATRAVALDAELPDAYRALSRHYRAVGDHARAEAVLRHAIALDPAFVPWRLRLGDLLEHERRYEEAEAIYAQALDQCPGEPTIILDQAFLDVMQHEYDQALAKAERVIQALPESPAPHVMAGLVHLNRNHAGKARIAFNKALALEKNNPAAMIGIGLAYLYDQECDMGLRQYQALFDAYPHLPDAKVGMAMAKRCDEDSAKAVVYYLEALKMDPHYDEANLGLCREYGLQTRLKEAQEEGLAALRDGAVASNAHHALGLSLIWFGELERGQEELEIAMAMDPLAAAPRRDLAHSLVQQRQYERAYPLAQEAVALAPHDALAYEALAIALIGQNQPEEAVPLLQEALALDPAVDKAHYWLAIAYRDMGRYEDAQQALQIFLADVPLEEQGLLLAMVDALGEGYVMSEKKALSDFETLLAGFLDHDVSTEVETVEGAGRTLTVVLNTRGAEPDESLFMDLGAAVAFASAWVGRIEPAIENGIAVDVRSYRTQLFRAEMDQAAAQALGDGNLTVMEMTDHLRFITPVSNAQTAMRTIQRDAAKLREWTAKARVPHHLVSREEMKEELAGRIDVEAREEIQASDAFLTLVDIIEPNDDLEQILNEMRGEQVLGFYDSEEEAFYLVRSDRQTASDQMTIVHEYVHALQDQHVGLDDILDLPEDELRNTDRQRAILALVEGDASLTMMHYAEQSVSAVDLLSALTDMGAADNEALEQTPDFVREISLFPYRDGLEFVADLHNVGGWEAVNEAYAALPQSTEQILHPEAYRRGDAPQDVALPDLAEALGEPWRERETDVLGELGLRLMLIEFAGPTVAAEAAEGWGGDRYRLLQQGEDGPLVLVMNTAWDDVDEADEFWDLFGIYVTRRDGYREVVAELVGERTQRRWTSDEGAVLAERVGGKGVLVLMSDDPAALEAVLAAVEAAS